MEKLKPFLVQKLTQKAPVRSSQDFGILIKSVPFKIFPKMKELTSTKWADEHGDDEYVPIEPTFEAYEIECQFLFIGDAGTANAKIKEFLMYLSHGGEFSFYDTYTGIGRTKVRYVDFSEDGLYRKERGKDRVIFKVKLKVNDPITDIKLTI